MLFEETVARKLHSAFCNGRDAPIGEECLSSSTKETHLFCIEKRLCARLRLSKGLITRLKNVLAFICPANFIELSLFCNANRHFVRRSNNLARNNQPSLDELGQCKEFKFGGSDQAGAMPTR